MSAPINQKEYLKKYLSGPSKDKKKKKKKTIKGAGLRIIDHDLDLSKLRPLDGDELDILGEGEDAPQVAGIIDERPEEIRKMEQFNTSSKWRVISQDDGFNSKLQIEEIKKDRKQQEEENVITFGKMYSDSEDETKKDSDVSPPRNNTRKLSHNDRDSDVSPPRKNSNSKATKGYDSDVSPPRKAEVKPKSKERRKPSRWGNDEGNKSPQRNSRRSRSPKRDRKNYDSDASPPRKSAKEQDRSRRDRNNYDSDESPPRKSAKAQERSRKDKNNYDSDVSPPRKSLKQKDTSRKDRNNYDSDASPPRKSKKVRRKSSDSNISPPRKSTKRRESPVRSKKETRRHKSNNSDSDMSPPRKSSYSKREKSPDSDVSPPRRNRRANDSPPPSNRKMAKTLEGKLAGLQDAVQLRKENEAFRRREEEAFSKMTDEVSGRNATVNRRNSKNARTISEKYQEL